MSQPQNAKCTVSSSGATLCQYAQNALTNKVIEQGQFAPEDSPVARPYALVTGMVRSALSFCPFCGTRLELEQPQKAVSPENSPTLPMLTGEVLALIRKHAPDGITGWDYLPFRHKAVSGKLSLRIFPKAVYQLAVFHESYPSALLVYSVEEGAKILLTDYVRGGNWSACHMASALLSSPDFSRDVLLGAAQELPTYVQGANL